MKTIYLLYAASSSRTIMVSVCTCQFRLVPHVALLFFVVHVLRSRRPHAWSHSQRHRALAAYFWRPPCCPSLMIGPTAGPFGECSWKEMFASMPINQRMFLLLFFVCFFISLSSSFKISAQVYIFICVEVQGYHNVYLYCFW